MNLYQTQLTKTLIEGESDKIPYQKFQDKELILRDYLAVDRTILANESTYLAYIRTSLNLTVVGVTILQLAKGHELSNLGYIFVSLAVLIFLRGTVRAIRFNRRIRKLIKEENKSHSVKKITH